MRYVGLLRGINVGKAKRVAMADLKKLVESLGYTDVRTLLNSGNVVFSGPAKGDHAGKIERALAEKLGLSSRVTVLSAEEVAAAIRDNPLLDIADNHSRLMVAVLQDPADRSQLVAITKQQWAPEVFALGKRVAYIWCPDGILESRLSAAVGKALGSGVTTRNWATFNKVQGLL